MYRNTTIFWRDRFRAGLSAVVPATASLVCVIAVSGCRRETRHFSGGQPDLSVTYARRLIDLQPGASQPSNHLQNPFEQDAYDLSEGKRLYAQFNCNTCHAEGGGDIGPPLMDSRWIYGASPENVYASIMEGRPNGMPSYRGHIPEQQVWQLIAYVRSMSGLVPQNAAPNRDDHMKTSPPENSVRPEKPNTASLPTNEVQPQ